jgi:hypothetical protein
MPGAPMRINLIPAIALKYVAALGTQLPIFDLPGRDLRSCFRFEASGHRKSVYLCTGLVGTITQPAVCVF